MLEQRRDAVLCEGFVLCTPNFPFPKHNGMFCTHSRTRVPEMGLSLSGAAQLPLLHSLPAWQSGLNPEVT